MSATPKWVTIVMGAAVAATMLGACSATPAATPSPALTTAGSANPDSAAVHNEADTAFAQMMIVHHQGAIEMADLAAQQAQSADVKALAERISAAQGPEIETMSDWLEDWDEEVPSTVRDHVNSHEGEGGEDAGMDGMDGMEGKLTNTKWAAIAKCSSDTALRDINHLLHSGVLARLEGGGRNTAYILVK